MSQPASFACRPDIDGLRGGAVLLFHAHLSCRGGYFAGPAEQMPLLHFGRISYSFYLWPWPVAPRVLVRRRPGHRRAFCFGATAMPKAWCRRWLRVAHSAAAPMLGFHRRSRHGLDAPTSRAWAEVVLEVVRRGRVPARAAYWSKCHGREAEAFGCSPARSGESVV